MSVADRLVLGTAQIGLDYGITNRQGKPSVDDAVELLHAAHERGIRTLDTAAAYGDAEERIGRAQRERRITFRLITKLSGSERTSVSALLRSSFENLGVDRIDGVLFHSFKAVEARPAAWNELEQLKESGLVGAVGVSLYHPSEWHSLCRMGIVPDLVQIPYSIFDQRFSETLPEMTDAGVEIHSRSAFLQGAVFFDPDSVPDHLRALVPALIRLRRVARDAEATLPGVCLAFASATPGIDKVVFGVASRQELDPNLLNVERALFSMDQPLLEELQKLRYDDVNVVVPANWPSRTA